MFYRFSGEIKYGAINSPADLFGALHEQGHRACRHQFIADGKVDVRDVLVECKAWAYARRCIRAEYIPNLEAEALRCIATYNAEAEINFGDWLSESEILSQIRRK
jgi:hypothetical protein